MFVKSPAKQPPSEPPISWLYAWRTPFTHSAGTETSWVSVPAETHEVSRSSHSISPWYIQSNSMRRFQACVVTCWPQASWVTLSGCAVMLKPGHEWCVRPQQLKALVCADAALLWCSVGCVQCSWVECRIRRHWRKASGSSRWKDTAAGFHCRLSRGLPASATDTFHTVVLILLCQCAD